MPPLCLFPLTVKQNIWECSNPTKKLILKEYSKKYSNVFFEQHTVVKNFKSIDYLFQKYWLLITKTFKEVFLRRDWERIPLYFILVSLFKKKNGGTSSFNVTKWCWRVIMQFLYPTLYFYSRASGSWMNVGWMEIILINVWCI